MSNLTLSVCSLLHDILLCQYQHQTVTKMNIALCVLEKSMYPLSPSDLLKGQGDILL